MVGILCRWRLPGGLWRIGREQSGSVFPQAPAKGREQRVILVRLIWSQLFLVCVRRRIIALNQALVHATRLIVLEGATVVRDVMLWLLVVDGH